MLLLLLLALLVQWAHSLSVLLLVWQYRALRRPAAEADDFAAPAGDEGDDFEPEPAPLAAEEDTASEALRELIANLVDNAIRYGRAGGMVTVHVARSPVSIAVEAMLAGFRPEGLDKALEGS